MDDDVLDASGPASAPDVAGVVVGWRTWKLVEGDRPALRSLTSDVTWTPGAATRASCRVGHAAPAPGCMCGLYATPEPGAAIRAGGTVLGCVTLWGEIIEGERGWRAEQGRPAALIVGPRVGEATRARLAEAHGVPVYAAGFTCRAVEDVTDHDGAYRRIVDADAEALTRAVAARAAGDPGADVAGATGALAATLAPEAHPPSLLRVLATALTVCALPDVWVAVATLVVPWLGPSPWWRILLDCLLVPVLFLGAFLMLLGPLVSVPVTLRPVLRRYLGAVGLLLWVLVVIPMTIGLVAHVLAVAALLSDEHVVWGAALLAAPAMTVSVALVVWAATRPAGRPSTARRWAWAAVAVLLVAAVTVAGVATSEAGVVADVGRAISAG